jgi:hypothetical protein
MASTAFPSPQRPEAASWHDAGLRYYSQSFFLDKKFGRRIWKVSLDAGCTCPNRDGTLGTAGCIFCDPESFSPSRRLRLGSITAQLEEGIRRVGQRHAATGFVAYFQPATNTYGPLAQLRRLYEEALGHPQVVGLAIGTRPDCAGDAVLDTLAELAGRTWVTLELGLQTIHDRTLDWLGRGHHADAFLDACRRSRQRGLSVGVHVILGLPGESREDMAATAGQVARLGVTSVKLHQLYAVRGTRLAEMVAAGTVRLPGREEYVRYVADFLEVLPPGCVIDRLSGDVPRRYLVGPEWSLDKAAIRRAVETELIRRGSWQGSRGEG